MGKRQESLEYAARDFWKAKPWKEVDDVHVFGVRDKETGFYGCASILGCAGEEFGLGISLGERGFSIMRRLTHSEIDNDTFMYELDGFLLSFTPKEQIPKKGGRDWDVLSIQTGNREIIAIVWRKRAAKWSRKLNRKEAQFLDRTIRAILMLQRERRLRQERLKTKEGTYLMFTLSGSLPNMDIEEGYEVHKSEEKGPSELIIPAELEKAIRSKPGINCYCVSLWTPPFSVKSELTRSLVVYDPGEDQVIYIEVFPAAGGTQAVGGALLEVLLGKAKTTSPVRCPREIWTDSFELYNHIKNALSKLGVRTICKDEIPELTRLRQSFTDFLSRDR